MRKNMHLLSEYTNYDDWGADDTRWAMMLRNRPKSLGIDYFVSDLEIRKTSKIDVSTRGFLKSKAKSEIGENEKSILKGELYAPIGYDWAFQILGGWDTENRKGHI